MTTVIDQRSYSKAAVWGFVLSFLVPIAGAILSHFGLAYTKSRQLKGRGLSIAGLVLGYVGIIRDMILGPWFVVFLMGIVFGMPSDQWFTPLDFWGQFF